MKAMKSLPAVLIAMAVLSVSAAGAVAAPAPTTIVAPSADDPAARAEVAALPKATAAMDADGNKLFDDLDAQFRTSAPGAVLPVQVVFVADTTAAEGVAEVRRVARGARIDRRFQIIPAFAGAMSLRDARAVAALERVRQIELDAVVSPTLDTASAAFGVTAIREQTGLTASLDGAADVATTDDVVIAVLDSGVDTGHVDLEGKLVDWVDVGNGHTTPRDDTRHGTHVTSTAAGWGRGSTGQTGVAPGAAIMAVKIAQDSADNSGTTTESVITAGLEYVLDHAEEFNVRVATMSYGGRLVGRDAPGDGTDANSLAIDALWDAGIVVHVSAGNGGPEAGSLTRQATARGAIAVGSVLDPFGAGDAPALNPLSPRDLAPRGGFSLSDFSSRGPTSDGRIKPDVLGPGDYITAARAGTRDGYVNFSGTSMSTPFVAGVSALLIAADPTLTPDEVREVLHRTAEDFGEVGPDPEYGHGRVRPVAALAAIAPGLAVDAPPVPRHTTRTVTLGPEGTATVEVEVDDFTHPLVITSVATSGRNYSGRDNTLDAMLDFVETFRPYGLTSTVVLDPESNVASDVRGITSYNGFEAPWSGPRQHTVTVLDGIPGRYTVQLTGTPDEKVVVDVSHSTTGP